MRLATVGIFDLLEETERQKHIDYVISYNEQLRYGATLVQDVADNSKAVLEHQSPDSRMLSEGSAREGEGMTDESRQRRRIPRAEAEVLVREWLQKNAKDDPARVTRDRVAAETGVSTGMVSETAAWKAFRARRDDEARPVPREVPLTDTMQAVIPADLQTPAELAELIESQRAEEIEEERRHSRRHRAS